MIKRILAVLLSLIFLFTFVACGDEKTYEAKRLEAPHIWMSNASEGWFYVSDKYAESLAVFNYHYPHSNPINYRQIAFLGHFKVWASLGKYDAFGLSAYDDNADIFYVREENNIELFYAKTEHEVLPPEEESYFGMLPIDISAVDRTTGMRKLLEGYYGGFVDVGGVRYIYTHGTLQGIKWVHAGYEFMLYVPEEYRLQFAKSFVVRMMDPNLAPAEKDAFNKIFDAYTEVSE